MHFPFARASVKDVCCINFGVLSSIIEKLPRSRALRRGTGLHRNTLSEALSSLQRAGYVKLDDGALWWTLPTDDGG